MAKNCTVKLILLFGLLLNSLATLHAQVINSLSLSSGGDFETVAFDVGDGVIVHLSKTGLLVRWGAIAFANRNNNFPERLEAYTGKADYFASTADSAFRGKIRFISRTYFTYFSSFENQYLAGKVKTIGNITFDYYREFENESFKGNIKSIGGQVVSWYPSFENSGAVGKLRSIGNTSLTYYGSFDEESFRGKVKTIGNVAYSYYGRNDLPQNRGGLKTGSPIVNVNGITFLMR